MLHRRQMLTGAVALAAVPALARAAGSRRGGRTGHMFPAGFMWGAATAPHQIEGNNTNSDIWYLEHRQPTFFSEPSGDAANSLFLWERDLDLAQRLGLNSYRFGIDGRGSSQSRGISRPQ